MDAPYILRSAGGGGAKRRAANPKMAALVNRAQRPDWEESVPNPALLALSAEWLNEALMAGRSCGFRAIVDAARLQHIVERQAVRDSLRADPQGPRRDHFDLAIAEPGAAAAVLDRGRAAIVPDDPGAASLRAMFEPRQRGDVGDALSQRRPGSGRTADFPYAGLSDNERRRLSRGHHQRCAGNRQKSRFTDHKAPDRARPLSQNFRSVRSARWARSRSSTSKRRSRPGSPHRHRPSLPARQPGTARSPSGHSRGRSGNRGEVESQVTSAVPPPRGTVA